jgi:dimethylaniline monooxygenase (N-oxide forming)
VIAMRAHSTSRRVAVIGAGPSGLTAVKELLEEGHQPICFEKAASLGGVFRFGEDDGVVWESCRLTSSGLLTAFSDFPVTPEFSGHMTARQYVDYLTRYCAAFDVTRHIASARTKR